MGHVMEQPELYISAPSSLGTWHCRTPKAHAFSTQSPPHSEGVVLAMVFAVSVLG